MVCCRKVSYSLGPFSIVKLRRDLRNCDTHRVSSGRDMAVKELPSRTLTNKKLGETSV